MNSKIENLHNQNEIKKSLKFGRTEFINKLNDYNKLLDFNFELYFKTIIKISREEINGFNQDLINYQNQLSEATIRSILIDQKTKYKDEGFYNNESFFYLIDKFHDPINHIPEEIAIILSIIDNPNYNGNGFKLFIDNKRISSIDFLNKFKYCSKIQSLSSIVIEISKLIFEDQIENDIIDNNKIINSNYVKYLFELEDDYILVFEKLKNESLLFEKNKHIINEFLIQYFKHFKNIMILNYVESLFEATNRIKSHNLFINYPPITINLNGLNDEYPDFLINKKAYELHNALIKYESTTTHLSFIYHRLFELGLINNYFGRNDYKRYVNEVLKIKMEDLYNKKKKNNIHFETNFENLFHEIYQKVIS